MAGKKSIGRAFKKGECANPAGRPKLDPELKAAREYNKQAVERILNEYLVMNQDQIKQRVKASATPSLEVLIGKIILQAILFGDHAKLDFMLNRMIGKVPTAVEVSGKLETPIQSFMQMTPEQRARAWAELNARNGD